MTENGREVSITQFVEEKIREEKDFLLSVGIKIRAGILFGSVQFGNIKPNGVSDIDLYFLAENENFPESISGQSLLENDQLRSSFSVETADFPPEIGLKNIRYRVVTLKNALDSLDRVIALKHENRPIDQMITYESEGGVKTTTIEEYMREATWVYQVFKTGQVIDGQIPKEILDKLVQVDMAMDVVRQEVIRKKKRKRQYLGLENYFLEIVCKISNTSCTYQINFFSSFNRMQWWNQSNLSK